MSARSSSTVWRRVSSSASRRVSRCSLEFELAEAALQSLLALVGPLLESRDLRSALADLRLSLVAAPCRLLLRRQQDGLRLLLGGADLLETAFGINVVRDAALRHGPARVQNSRNRKCGRNNH